jgi:hypothetical protein
MKNIHILPTDKPSRLYKTGNFLLLDSKAMPNNTLETKNQHIYITSDEEIKEGDWYLNVEEKNGIKNPFYGKLYKANQSICQVPLDYLVNNLKKIILTTDQNLINDGVQTIGDEFLEWFVKNPSCEWVDVLTDAYTMQEIFELKLQNDDFKYKIIIPKEEPKALTKLEIAKNIAAIGIGKEKPKQETLEEAINNFKKTDVYINEIKQKQERMYSEEDLREAFKSCYTPFSFDRIGDLEQDFNKWFEQFKNK